jgi:hypothetical protein
MSQRLVAGCVLIASLAAARPALADETDNFTCRLRVLRDSLAAFDSIMNARIQAALAQANAGPQRCDEACLRRTLQENIGGTDRHLAGIPHSRFERWIAERADVDRCRVSFRDSIYGARPYDQPWLFPFTGRVIFIADSVRLAGTMVGLDKINHFLLEGLAHWKSVQQPDGNIGAVMAKELGPPHRQFRWTEYGLKGWSLTGVVAYADLAAGYSGYRFWRDVSSIGQRGSFVGSDPASGRLIQRRAFTFAEYVNGSWDEGINCSVFHPTLAKQVNLALQARSMTCPASPAEFLSLLPDAALYVNPSLGPRPR